MHAIQYWIQKILNAGIRPDTHQMDASRIQVANAYLVFALPLILFNTINNIIQKDSIGFGVGFIWLGLLATIPIFNAQKKHQFVFHSILILATIMTNLIYLLLGKTIMASPIYIVALLTAISFFDNFKIRLGYFLFVIANFIGIQVYLTHYPSFLAFLQLQPLL